MKLTTLSKGRWTNLRCEDWRSKHVCFCLVSFCVYVCVCVRVFGKVELSDIGTPYKLRVEHDNANLFPGWHLDKVIELTLRCVYMCFVW